MRSRAASSPIRSCSSASIGPSSAMRPMTAMHRPSSAIQRAARRAAAIDAGFALYESSMTRKPPAPSKTSILPDETRASPSAAAISAAGTPSDHTAAAAARVSATRCSPGTERSTRPRPSGSTRSNEAHPVSWESAIRSARTTAPSDVP